MFAYRYWLVESENEYRIIRGRLNPTWFNGEFTLTDGPFDTQEDAARSMAFWLANDGYKDTETDDETDESDWWREAE